MLLCTQKLTDKELQTANVVTAVPTAPLTEGNISMDCWICGDEMNAFGMHEHAVGCVAGFPVSDTAFLCTDLSSPSQNNSPL